MCACVRVQVCVRGVYVNVRACMYVCARATREFIALVSTCLRACARECDAFVCTCLFMCVRA